MSAQLFEPDYRSGKRIFFVTGRSKSGNTWMSIILNSHPEIFCDRSEISAFHQDLQLLLFGREINKLSQAVGDFYTRRYRDLIKYGFLANLLRNCDKSEAKIMGDKSPRQDIDKILDAFPKAKIIIMLRDSRDQLVSQAFHAARKSGSWKGVFTTNERVALTDKFLEKTISQFQLHKDIEKYLSSAKAHPDQVKIVRYEDLKNEPEKTVSDCLDLLGAKLNDAIVKDCIENASFEKLSGGRTSGQEDENSFFRKGIIGDWRNCMDKRNINMFKKLAGEELIITGYENDNNWAL